MSTHEQTLISLALMRSTELCQSKRAPTYKYYHYLQVRAYGIRLVLRTAGLPSIVKKDVSADAILSNLRRGGISHLCVVPTIARRLLKAIKKPTPVAPLNPSLILGCTGAALQPDDIKSLREELGVRIYTAYGGGETGGLVSYLLPSDIDRAMNDPDAREILSSVGRPGPHADIKIGSDGKHESGEILVRARSNFSGYWKQDLETSKTLDGETVRTGDLGQIVDGYLYVTDRIKDIIISGGMNVAPAEVERVLESHADVLHAAVVGLPHAEWGEEVHAVLELRATRLSKAEVQDSIFELVKHRLIDFACDNA